MSSFDGMRFAGYQSGYLGVTREAQHQLIEHILEHKVLVVIGGGQLNVLKYQFVNDVIGGQHDVLQPLPVFVCLHNQPEKDLEVIWE